MIDVHEVSETELKSVKSHGVWDHSGIIEFAKDLSVNHPNKVVGMPIENAEIGSDGKPKGFYNNYYLNNKRIQHINHYCRKHLEEAFKELNVPADVRTNKNTLLVSLNNSAAEEIGSEEGSDVEEPSEPETTSEEEE